MFTLAAGEAQAFDRSSRILFQPGREGRIGPCLCHDPGAVAWADFGFIGVNQNVKRCRIDVALLNEKRFKGPHPQGDGREFRMLLVVVVAVVWHVIFLGVGLA